VWITIYLGSIDRLGRIGTAHTDFPEQETRSQRSGDKNQTPTARGAETHHTCITLVSRDATGPKPLRAAASRLAARAGGAARRWRRRPRTGGGRGGEVRARGDPVSPSLVVRCCVCVVCSVPPAGLVPSQLLAVWRIYRYYTGIGLFFD
jgi:hypothetical protein